MILEDIKYQLEQFYSFDNIKLSFEALNQQGFIFFSNGKILSAVWGQKRDIEVFRALKDLDLNINIHVSIGEPPPEATLGKYFDEILETVNESSKDSDPEKDIDRKNNSRMIDATEKASPGLVVRISESLAVIPGVESILAVKDDGEVVFSKGVDDAEFESADAMFLYNQSKELGDILNFNSLKSAICEANNYKKIIINNKNILYSMKISSEAPALKTQMEAAKLIKDF